ncbi:MAG: molybdate ABC transporter substrate-binding protein [Methyloprofundus sp.]|nr:molybdate ABC transporter substrate-binding protein [Methyloprofundus sp.]MDT8425142.1 molybdate ABC transporter substrate-binding protein [Methyloprofundus sp.]
MTLSSPIKQLTLSNEALIKSSTVAGMTLAQYRKSSATFSLYCTLVLRLIKNRILGYFFLILFAPILSATEIPVIAAASNIKFALEEIATAFHQETGKSLHISYGSSGNLTRQIQQGGPFELFLSANAHYVEQLYQQHKTLDQGHVFALGRLALLTPINADLMLDDQLNGLKNALQSGQLQRIAIANPEHAPFGIAAREALQKQQLWIPLQPHLILGENVAQATQFASSGAVQVGLVSYSLALAPALKNRVRYALISDALHQPLQQTAVLLNNAGDTAKLFFHYLLQEKARGILSRHGYTTP